MLSLQGAGGRQGRGSAPRTPEPYPRTPEQAGVRGQALRMPRAHRQVASRPKTWRRDRWHPPRGEEPQPPPPRPSPSLPPPDGQPLAGSPRPSRCRLCGPGRMPLFISQTPLPFDSPLPGVSADLCVLGIQLEARTARVTAAPNPASAPASTLAAPRCLSCCALRGLCGD